jgi:Amino acid permease
MPGLSLFGQGTKGKDEPTYAIIVTHIVAQATMLFDINRIASFVTSMYARGTRSMPCTFCFVFKAAWRSQERYCTGVSFQSLSNLESAKVSIPYLSSPPTPSSLEITITNFESSSVTYLMTFLVTNLACFLLKVGSAPNFRPSFHYFNWQTAAFGAIISILSMFFVDGVYASGSVAVLLILFLMIHYTTPPKSWGDVSQSL